MRNLDALRCDGCRSPVDPDRGAATDHGVFCSTGCLDDWIDGSVY